MVCGIHAVVSVRGVVRAGREHESTGHGSDGGGTVVGKIHARSVGGGFEGDGGGESASAEDEEDRGRARSPPRGAAENRPSRTGGARPLEKSPRARVRLGSNRPG